jgi:hypothetical protein
MNGGAVPDPLLRRVALPYRFSARQGALDFRIESNDLNIALFIRQFMLESPQYEIVRRWRLIRDPDGSANDGSYTAMKSRALTMIVSGTATILVFDCERGEVVGFIGADVLLPELSGLLARLFNYASQIEPEMTFDGCAQRATLLQTGDNQKTAP